MICLKSDGEIDIMREGGKILGDLMDKFILCKIVEGVSTKSIDKYIEEYILNNNAVPILKGYSVDNKVYNYSSCISFNEVVCHTPPSDRAIKFGDIVTVDVCIKYKGYCLDAARTFAVGNVSSLIRRLIDVSEQSFFKGLEQFKIGNRLGDVSNAVQEHIESNSFKVIKDFCGHGIGASLHEDPQLLNYGEKGYGPIINKGLAVALEPMLSLEDEWTHIADDEWSAVTRGKSLSSHYENTIVALEEGPEILTMSVNK